MVTSYDLSFGSLFHSIDRPKKFSFWKVHVSLTLLVSSSQTVPLGCHVALYEPLAAFHSDRIIKTPNLVPALVPTPSFLGNPRLLCVYLPFRILAGREVFCALAVPANAQKRLGHYEATFPFSFSNTGYLPRYSHSQSEIPDQQCLQRPTGMQILGLHPRPIESETLYLHEPPRWLSQNTGKTLHKQLLRLKNYG